MFSLDYHTIIRTLEMMHYTGSAEAFIPSGDYAKGKIFLEVQGGVIQTCIIFTASGQQVNSVNLITEHLSRCGILEWNLMTTPGISSRTEERSPSSSHLPLSPPIPPFSSRKDSTPQSSLTPTDMILLSPTSYPQRIPIDASHMNAWPFSHRQVYNLSTGQYSEQDIARMLHYPPRDLLTIFKELERLEVLIRGF